MSTASDQAPAAEQSVEPGADGIASRRRAVAEPLSLTQAAREFGLNRHTLRAALDAGKVRAERIERRGLGPDGIGFLFDPRELKEDLAALAACRYPGCNRLALRVSGGCEAHGHVYLGPRARGVKRPDIGPKISAAKTGKPRPDQAERIKESLRTGDGIWAGIIDRDERPLKGRTKQRLKGRWGSTKPPAPGARPRGRPSIELTDEQRRRIRLARRHWGRRKTANEFGLSEWAVRLVELDDDA